MGEGTSRSHVWQEKKSGGDEVREGVQVRSQWDPQAAWRLAKEVLVGIQASIVSESSERWQGVLRRAGAPPDLPEPHWGCSVEYRL